MEYREQKIRTLTATEGHKLTQAGEVEDRNRMFAGKIYLAVNDAPENYREVTDTEADAFQAARLAEEERLRAEAEKEEKRRQLEAELAALNAPAES